MYGCGLALLSRIRHRQGPRRRGMALLGGSWMWDRGTSLRPRADNWALWGRIAASSPLRAVTCPELCGGLSPGTHSLLPQLSRVL